MKKIFTSMLVAAMILFNGISAASALSQDESYNAAKKYYSQKTELISFDEVIAYESLGLDSSSLAIDEIINTKYASGIAKAVIMLILHGDDPRDYKGINYVEMLENCVQSNGAFDKTESSTYANNQVYGVYALYTINSSKTELAADYLASLIDDDGMFGSSYGPSLDISAWCIEALTLVNKTKYQETISKVLTQFESKQNDEAAYMDPYMGANLNTQACILSGIITYDQAGLKNGIYNKEGNNPYDFMLKYQNEDGSFWYDVEGEDNYYATVQGVLTVGYNQNGSIYSKALKDYQVIINSSAEEKPTEPTPDQKEPVEKQPETDIKADAVETSDNTQIVICLGMIISSGYVVIRRKKIFG